MGKVAVALWGFSVAVKVAFVVLWAATASLLYVNKVYAPPMKFTLKRDMSDLPLCGPTTENMDDLIVHDELSQDEAEDLAKTHGMAIVPTVLKNETASALREYILKANQVIESSTVHEPENRYHIALPHTEPTVQQSLKEIAEHPVLRPLLERVLGPSPSLVAMSAITTVHGAKDQPWHHDALVGDSVYPDHFVPEWGVAVALQDTTAEMGATGICPGTHHCSFPKFDYQELFKQFDADPRLQRRYGDELSWLEDNLPCPMQAVTKQGDSFIYSEIMHRGAAHVDPDAPERVVLFLSLAGSRQGPQDKRILPLGDSHDLRWDSWGLTIEDFSTMKERPWRMWHLFGLFHQAKGNVRPWNLIDSIAVIFTEDNEVAPAIGEYFNAEYLEGFTYKLLFRTGVATAIYFVVSLMLICFNHWKSVRVNIIHHDKKNKSL